MPNKTKQDKTIQNILKPVEVKLSGFDCVIIELSVDNIEVEFVDEIVLVDICTNSFVALLRVLLLETCFKRVKEIFISKRKLNQMIFVHFNDNLEKV